MTGLRPATPALLSARPEIVIVCIGRLNSSFEDVNRGAAETSLRVLGGSLPHVDEGGLEALLEAGTALFAELDPDVVLHRLLDTAREVTGARYAAIGVLDEHRRELERFITAGIDQRTQQTIGDLPRGRGVLGVLIEDPRPLRLQDVGTHRFSYGFPPGHPPMKTFLGVPIMIQGEAWGNLYLTEKPEDFTDADERATVMLAGWAGIAILNARRYRYERDQRTNFERAYRTLETTTEIARALGGVTDLDRALELVVKRSRALIAARAAAIALVEGDQLATVAVAGEGLGLVLGERQAINDSIAAEAMRTGRPDRITGDPGRDDAHATPGSAQAIVVPMIFKGRVLGVLTVQDRAQGSDAFTSDDMRLLEAFATTGATAVATAQSASDEALRRSLAASEAERARWARELHDETLQELAGLRVLLSAARRTAEVNRMRAAIDDAVELIGGAAHNLRSLIADLRPAALDELGLEAAIRALAERFTTTQGLDVTLDLDLNWETERTEELNISVYRLAQEALTNIVKHAQASRAEVVVHDGGGWIVVRVRDDGVGFDKEVADLGFGLLGMRERAALLDGTLEVLSTPGDGTLVTARLPLHSRPAAAIATGT